MWLFSFSGGDALLGRLAIDGGPVGSVSVQFANLRRDEPRTLSVGPEFAINDLLPVELGRAFTSRRPPRSEVPIRVDSPTELIAAADRATRCGAHGRSRRGFNARRMELR